jgi:hypothetical protein
MIHRLGPQYEGKISGLKWRKIRIIRYGFRRCDFVAFRVDLRPQYLIIIIFYK